MIWAVLDTNVLVSRLGWRGPPSQVIDLALEGRFIMISSPPLLDELASVLEYPRLAPHFPDPVGTVLLVRSASVIVTPNQRLHVVQDEPDNRVLEAAQAGDADYIVTGDPDLLTLRFFEGTEIVQPVPFLEAI